MTFNPLTMYREQMAHLQAENTIYNHNICQLVKYLYADPTLQLEIDSLQTRIASNINHLRMLRVNILAIQRSLGQIQFDTAEAIESINIIQDALQKQLYHSSTAKYFVQDYQHLELTKQKLREVKR